MKLSDSAITGYAARAFVLKAAHVLHELSLADKISRALCGIFAELRDGVFLDRQIPTFAVEPVEHIRRVVRDGIALGVAVNGRPRLV